MPRPFPLTPVHRAYLRAFELLLNADTARGRAAARAAMAAALARACEQAGVRLHGVLCPGELVRHLTGAC